MRITAALDPTDRDYMLVTVWVITTERPRLSKAEAIDDKHLRIVHEIHGNGAFYVQQ